MPWPDDAGHGIPHPHPRRAEARARMQEATQHQQHCQRCGAGVSAARTNVCATCRADAVSRGVQFNPDLKRNHHAESY